MRAMINRRHALLLGAALACASSAWAQADWPSKPVKIVVPFAPGGTTDLTARIVAEQLTQVFKQNFIVENKAGAGGNLGAAEVAKAAPDGYTFLMGTPGTQAINQFLYPKMPYDTAKGRNGRRRGRARAAGRTAIASSRRRNGTPSAPVSAR